MGVIVNVHHFYSSRCNMFEILSSKNCYLQYISPTHETLLITDIVNMPRNNVQADSRYQKTVEFLCKNPNLTVWDTIQLANCLPQEWEDKVKYMMLTCMWKKTNTDDFVTPPSLPIAVSRGSTSEPLSLVTISLRATHLDHSLQRQKRERSLVQQQLLRSCIVSRIWSWRRSTTSHSNVWHSCTHGRRNGRRNLACLQGMLQIKLGTSSVRLNLFLEQFKIMSN